ncbi:MAG: STAS domain-containing protein [Thermoguttaceae bacterium]
MTLPSSDPEPNLCPFCNAQVVVEPSGNWKDVPCQQCGQLLWFLRKPLGDVVALTFFPGPIISLDSIARVKLVTSVAGDLSRVVVNLSHLSFIPTVFLGMLVALHRRVGEAGGQLKLCGLNPKVLATFKITNLDRVFEIHDSEQSALASF